MIDIDNIVTITSDTAFYPTDNFTFSPKNITLVYLFTFSIVHTCELSYRFGVCEKSCCSQFVDITGIANLHEVSIMPFSCV